MKKYLAAFALVSLAAAVFAFDRPVVIMGYDVARFEIDSCTRTRGARTHRADGKTVYTFTSPGTLYCAGVVSGGSGGSGTTFITYGAGGGGGSSGRIP